MDSMVNHYTVAKHRRKTDAYSPGGKMGLRPDHAVRRLRQPHPAHVQAYARSSWAASRRRLRRLVALRLLGRQAASRSILLDSGADLVSYGMGERSIIAIAEALAGWPEGTDDLDLHRRHCVQVRARSGICSMSAVVLPTFEQMQADQERLRQAALACSTETSTRFRRTPSWKSTPTASSSCRTHRQNRFRPRRWTPSTHCPTRVPTHPSYEKRGRRCPRYQGGQVLASPATAVAWANALSARSTSTRAASSSRRSARVASGRGRGA